MTTLSLILCARNDEYMGNSRWRLETALCYAARQLSLLGLDDRVEIIVADWGSSVPLCDVLRLTPEAAAIVSFLNIPQAVSRDLQQDSPFAEVLALNAAARRSNGEYVGRIDQDTLIGARFLTTFFALHAGRRSLPGPLDRSLLFANLRFVPYRLAVRCPPLPVIEWFVRTRGGNLDVAEPRSPIPFYAGQAGICMMHRSLWYESGGYDEKMIYMNAMETNLARRILMRHEVINIGALDGHDFYHLEHYHPSAVRRTSTHRKVNPHLPFSAPETFNPNEEGWGLADHAFEKKKSTLVPVPAATPSEARAQVRRFMPQYLAITGEMAADLARVTLATWTRRSAKARDRFASEPLHRWPRAMKELWLRKPSDAAGHAH